VTPDRIEQLVAKVRALPDQEARNVALELVQGVMDLHSSALERALQIVGGAKNGSEVIRELGADHLVGGVLLLHDLHPVDLETRVRQALDRPEFHARGASAELLSIKDGTVRVKIDGGHGLRTAVEAALNEAAPDAVVEIDGATAMAGFVPLTALVAG
jgi:hypothetical protein